MSFNLSRIQLLSPLVAERIAAGEVIERPASVVKELVENSVDAGATQVEVRLIDGGCDEIEISDNGSGMDPKNLEVCLLRHATSKIVALEDLESLGTLGFRGEALPSIASVAKINITSRAVDSESTHQVQAAFQAPARAAIEPAAHRLFLGSPHGTTVTVRSLFSQTPVRLKFLKSPASETTAVREIIERIAGCRPGVSFTLFSDGKKLLDLKAGDRAHRVTELLDESSSRATVGELVSSVSKYGDSNVEIFWLKGASLPNTRKILQFVNGRSLRDRILQQAILNPFRQSFLPGHFPAIAVYVQIPGTDIDVNAHPTKAEVRFRDPKTLFSLLNAAIDELKMRHRIPAVEARDWTPGFSGSGGFSAGSGGFSGGSGFSSGGVGSGMTGSNSGDVPYFSSQPGQDFIADTGIYPGSTTPLFQSPYAQGSFDAGPLPNRSSSYLGNWFETYFIFQKDGKIWLVDQHAAHERIRYEKLKKRALANQIQDAQALLIPEIIQVEESKMRAIQSRIPWLKSLGFDVESFSEKSIVFRAIPHFWGLDNLNSRLNNLIQNFSEASDQDFVQDKDHNPIFDEALFEKIAMQACRSSVKAHDHVPPEVAVNLFQELLECEHPGNCPHGRPTWVEISESRIEQWFNRKV